MSRPRRRTSARGQQVVKRTTRTPVEDLSSSSFVREGSNWFMRQSVNTQVYFMKIAFGISAGFLMGLLYESKEIASSWWWIPFFGLLLVVSLVRFVFKYTVDDLSWPKLILLSGTFGMFVGFIFTSTLVWLISYPEIYSI